MPQYTVKIEETDYRHLEQVAQFLGISVKDTLSKMIEEQRYLNKQKSGKLKKSESVYDKPSRWAKISHRIRKKPPLRGAGDYVRECSKEFRNDFSLRHDAE